MDYDILIVGGGPAGLSAAINGRARGKTVLLLSSPMEDSPLWKAERVENYLGLPGVTGAELLTAFHRHAEASGAEIRELRALSAMPAGERWYLSGEDQVFEGRALILAAGAVRGKPLPGEERLLGRGVSYCATCDGMLYRGRNVVVLGWTGSAEREADFLRSIGCAVRYYDRPRGVEILGDETVTGVRVNGREEAADAVFLLRPAVAPAALLPGLAMENGSVTVDRQMATNLPGVFAAGDCTGAPYQVAKAVGEGLIAGQSAAKWADRQG